MLNAKKITLFSTFTEGGFAEKNIEKTAAHFKKMKNKSRIYSFRKQIL